jgi:hypothetical protein
LETGVSEGNQFLSKKRIESKKKIELDSRPEKKICQKTTLNSTFVDNHEKMILRKCKQPE